MKVLVSDTSVLIDLERVQVLEPSFRLPFEFVVPDLLYDLELKARSGAVLLKLGLKVEELDGPGVELARHYRRMRRALSLPDCFALALARTHSWTLLSGDGELRELAREERVPCHGVLWLLDRMFEGGVVRGNKLCDGLRKLAGHERCRLPKVEIQKRLKRYSGV